MKERTRHKFYFSSSHKWHLVGLSGIDCFMYPDGYLELLALLDSGDIVEYTSAVGEHDELPPGTQEAFPDYIYLGTGVMNGYGKRLRGSINYMPRISPADRKPIKRQAAPAQPQATFEAICDRCKQQRTDCLSIRYNIPPSLTPPSASVDASIPSAIMCGQCRELKEKYSKIDENI